MMILLFSVYIKRLKDCHILLFTRQMTLLTLVAESMKQIVLL